MSVLIFADHADGHFKKSSFEALSYGAALAAQLGTDAAAVVVGSANEDLATLGKYGISKVYHAKSEALNTVDSRLYIAAIVGAVANSGADIIVFSQNQTGRMVAPGVAAKLGAGLVSGAVGLPETSSGFTVKKNVFSGKAFANVSILSGKKVISINPNSYAVKAGEGSATVEEISPEIPAPSVKLKSVNKVSGEVPLTEAEVVVSAGRGLKGPENWGMVEDLAKVLHAALACSRPVADSDWRPHHEHVGQTGVQIAPNLYIALGISGAIQHLAGVNRSKTIVVINKDAEAPFFKAADYGIVGDVFEVVPKLIEEIKKVKGGN